MEQTQMNRPQPEGEGLSQSTQPPWVADLDAITVQGSTDAQALFSFGQRRAKDISPLPRAAITHPMPRTRRPEVSYIIVATPRCGSYLLADILVQTNLAGRPIEYFTTPICREFFRRWNISSYADYLEGVFHLGTTPNGVFGAILCWTDMPGLIANLQSLYPGKRLPTGELLSRTFPNLHYIVLTRRDRVRQAISYWRASWTGEWLRLKDAKRPAPPPVAFDFEVIDNLVQSLEQHDEEIQQYFSEQGIDPLTIYYEELAKAHRETALQILDCLHVPHPEDLVLPELATEKQADRWSEEMVEQYHQFLAE